MTLWRLESFKIWTRNVSRNGRCSYKKLTDCQAISIIPPLIKSQSYDSFGWSRFPELLDTFKTWVFLEPEQKELAEWP